MDETKKQPEEITDVLLPELSQTDLAQVAGGAGTGKVNFQDFHFTQSVQKSSPLLEVTPTLAQSAAAAGELSGDELSNVVGGGTKTQAPAEKPTESISLNFSKTHLEY
jgi:type VI protein secretion system component Hcp